MALYVSVMITSLVRGLAHNRYSWTSTEVLIVKWVQIVKSFEYVCIEPTLGRHRVFMNFSSLFNQPSVNTLVEEHAKQF